MEFDAKLRRLKYDDKYDYSPEGFLRKMLMTGTLKYNKDFKHISCNH